MAKELEIIQTQFNAGMFNDPRNIVAGGCKFCVGFDIFTDPRRLIPFRDSESGDSSAATHEISNFCVAKGTSGVYRFFGLGLAAGAAQVYSKDLSTGGSHDFGDANWITYSKSTGSFAPDMRTFVYYETAGFIYGLNASGNFYAYDPAASVNWNDSVHTLSFTNCAQGLVHSKDDVYYQPYDNKIASNNNGTWNDTALTLPARFKITSITEDGNYLAIAVIPLSGVGHSRTFLWDRDSSLATLSETIDWGEGNLMALGELDGYLLGITLIGNSSTVFNSRIVFSYYSDTEGAVPFLTLVGDTNLSATLLSTIQKSNGRLLFGMSISLGGTIREGVWAIGRTSTGFGISLERLPNNDTPIGIGGLLITFIKVGDYVFTSYIAASDGNYHMSKTNDQNSYTATSYYETFIYNNGDSSIQKKPVGVTVMTEPMPASGEVAMLYKEDAATSFTEIFTNGDDGAISHSAVNIEADDTEIPEAKEISFRIESTNGTVITGFSYEPDILDSRLY